MPAGSAGRYCLLNLHLEGFAFFYGLGEAGHELGDLFKVLEVDDFDGAVHVAVGEADEGARDAASGPEYDVGVGAAGGADGLML